jgi:hypothetical protein
MVVNETFVLAGRAKFDTTQLRGSRTFPAFVPFHRGQSLAGKEVILQTGGNHLGGRFESIKVEVKQGIRPPRYSLTRAKVGDWIRSVMPSDLAIPFTNWVFPAPRSPVTPKTQPWDAIAPSRAPKATVSAGLREMNVSMCGRFSYAIDVPQAQAGPIDDAADAGDRGLGKTGSPSIQDRDGVSRRDREQQFEILAVGECRQERAVWRRRRPARSAGPSC